VPASAGCPRLCALPSGPTTGAAQERWQEGSRCAVCSTCVTVGEPSGIHAGAHDSPAGAARTKRPPAREEPQAKPSIAVAQEAGSCTRPSGGISSVDVRRVEGNPQTPELPEGVRVPNGVSLPCGGGSGAPEGMERRRPRQSIARRTEHPSWVVGSSARPLIGSPVRAHHAGPHEPPWYDRRAPRGHASVLRHRARSRPRGEIRGQRGEDVGFNVAPRSP
jgi:hypothetical protein